MKVIWVLLALLALDSSKAFHGDNTEAECVACLDTQYCTGGAVFSCPDFSRMGQSRTGTIEGCVCIPGYLKDVAESQDVPGDFDCYEGQPPNWYFDGIRQICPTNKATDAIGADEESDCKCVPGFKIHPSDADLCEGCANDQYTEGYDETSCQNCPDFSQGPPESNAQTNCICNAGYTGPDGGECTACAGGTFKNAAGSALCVNCDTDEFSLAGADSCTDCHANSASPEGSDARSDCKCNQGYSPDNVETPTACELCEIGYAKNTVENEACQQCGPTEIAATAGSHTCSSCLPFSSAVPSAARDACVCPAGYKPDAVNYAGKGLDALSLTSTIPTVNHYRVDFVYPGGDIVNKFMEIDLALIDLEGYNTIAESFKILEFSNFGFDKDDASDHTYSATINIKQQDGQLIDTVALTFLQAAGTTRLELTQVTSTADDEVSRRNIILPSVFRLNKQKLAAQFAQGTNDIEASARLNALTSLDPAVTTADVAQYGNDIAEASALFGTSSSSTYYQMCTDNFDENGEPMAMFLPNRMEHFTLYTALASLNLNVADCQTACNEYVALSHADANGDAIPDGTLCTGIEHFVGIHEANTDSRQCLLLLNTNSIDLKDVDCSIGWQDWQSHAASTLWQFRAMARVTSAPFNFASYYSVANERKQLLVSLHAHKVRRRYPLMFANYYLSFDNLDPIPMNGGAQNGYSFLFDMSAKSDPDSEYATLSDCQDKCDERTDCVGIQYGELVVENPLIDDSFYCGLILLKDATELTEDAKSRMIVAHATGNIISSIYEKNVAVACEQCPGDHYLNEAVPTPRGSELCLQCPRDSTSAAGSDNILDCECNAGYEKGVVDGLVHHCVACGVGKYKDTVHNDNTCQACPSDSNTDSTASSSINDCLCKEGYEGIAHDTGCTECAAGKIKTSLSDGSCDNCGAGTYQDQTGKTVCESCPLNSQSEPRSDAIDDCVCDAGYERDGDVCNPCQPGFFKAADSNVDRCVRCGTDTFSSSEAATECTACESNEQNLPDHTECHCNAGYFLNAQNPPTCQACAPGTYKENPGNALACDTCLLDASTDSNAKTTRAACLCNAGYTSSSDGVAADDIFGFECVGCESGKYREGLGTGLCTQCDPEHRTDNFDLPWDSASDCTECILCEAGKYKSGGCTNVEDTICTECSTVDPYSSSSEATADQPNSGERSCVCIPGYGGAPNYASDASDDDSSCQLCENSFKGSLANEACTPCGDYGVTDPSSFPNIDVEACVCPAGQTFDEGQSACVDCTAGKFKSELGDTACPDCATGYSTDTGGQTSCVCDRGYGSDIPDPLDCVICQAGKVSDEISTAACSDCPRNEYQLQAGQESCDPCPADSSTDGATGQSVCTCNVGYQIGDGSTHCDSCVADNRDADPPVDGTYKDQLTPDSCENCQAGCLANQRVISFCDTENDLICDRCQDNSNSPANEYLVHCYCNSGYEFDVSDNECKQCDPGTYKQTNNDNGVTCQDCTEGTDFAANPGSASCTPCSTECETGKFIEVTCQKDADIDCEPCKSCPAGEYRTGSCTKTGTDDYKCETCTPGFYCPGGDIQSQSQCPGGATSPPGSSSEEECGCVAGEYSDAGTCTECPANSWCIQDQQYLCMDSVNPNPGAAPDSDSVASDPGSSDVADCICQPGYYKIDTGGGEHTCNKCQANTYCPDDNAGSETDCPDLSDPYQMVSAEGSDDVADCLCEAGSYNNPDNSQCLECTANTFCTGDGSLNACAIFRTHSWNQDALGSTTFNDCVCQPGYYLNGNVCDVCEAGKYCAGTGAPPQSCPTDSTSPTGSDDLFDCRCNGGYEREEDQGAGTLNCRECTDTEFCSGGVKGTCNENSKTPIGLAQSATDCVCNDGYKTIGRDDQNRVECQLCKAGTYCSNGNQYLCSDLGAHLSTEGPEHDDVTDCKCEPGYYTVSELDGNGDYAPVCAACDGDTYCPGYGTASDAKSSCPANSLAEAPADELSDCECEQMFYKLISTAPLFTCEQCENGFYCPPQSTAPVACPSANMHSNSPRREITDCQCDDGYHNNNADTDDSTVCDLCPVDHYCSGNGITSCNDPSTPNTHTNGATGQFLVEHCICQRGFGIFSNGGTCSLCQANYYCPGDGTTGDPLTHENAELCDQPGECLQTYSCDSSSPHTRVSDPGAFSFDDCECIAGFAHTLDEYGNVIPECAECVYNSPNGGFWKNVIGNSACNACKPCTDEGEYYTAECQTTSDTACTPCPTCSHSCTPPSEGEPGSEGYPHCDTNFVKTPCSGSNSGECAECRKCTTSPAEGETLEYYEQTCQPESNAVCADVDQSVPGNCIDGEVRGGHTETSQSRCIPCSLPDSIQYRDANLHYFDGPGTLYNQQTSCPFKCVPNSKLVSQTEGCTTCETGNFLFRIPAQNSNELGQFIDCAFTCRHNTVLNADQSDCVIAHISLDSKLQFQHTIAVSNYARNDPIGYKFTVTHTTHSRYVVFVGRERVGKQSGCRPGNDMSQCCSAVTASRVSSLQEGGFGESSTTCEQSASIIAANTPPAHGVTTATLEFTIWDSKLEEVASCTNEIVNQRCLFFVTMFDVLHMRGISVPIEILIDSTSSTEDYGAVALTGPGVSVQYLPLSAYAARVVLIADPQTTETNYVYEVEFALSVDASSLTTGENLDVNIFTHSSAITQIVNSAYVPSCSRYTPPTDVAQNFQSTLSIPNTQTNTKYTWVTFWSSESKLDKLAVGMELQKRSPLSQELLAHVGIYRGLSQLDTICVPNVQSVQYTTSETYFVSGYGNNPTSRIQRLNKPTASSLVAEAQLNLVNDNIRGRATRLVSFIIVPHTNMPSSISVRSMLSVHFTQQAYSIDKVHIDDKLQNAFVNTENKAILDFTPAFRTWCRNFHYSASADETKIDCLYEYHRPLQNSYFTVTVNTGSCTSAQIDDGIAFLKTQLGIVEDSANHVSSMCSYAASFGKQDFVIAMAILKSSSDAKNMEERVVNVVTQSFVWIDSLVTI